MLVPVMATTSISLSSIEGALKFYSRTTTHMSTILFVCVCVCVCVCVWCVCVCGACAHVCVCVCVCACAHIHTYVTCLYTLSLAC